MANTVPHITITINGEPKTIAKAYDDVNTWERFAEVREIIKERNPDREVTNEEIVSLLIDVWWHHESLSDSELPIEVGSD